MIPSVLLAHKITYANKITLQKIHPVDKVPLINEVMTSDVRKHHLQDIEVARTSKGRHLQSQLLETNQ
jgi:hypothetical protein